MDSIARGIEWIFRGFGSLFAWRRPPLGTPEPKSVAEEFVKVGEEFGEFGEEFRRLFPRRYGRLTESEIKEAIERAIVVELTRKRLREKAARESRAARE
jgi:hypothetical protein